MFSDILDVILQFKYMIYLNIITAAIIIIGALLSLTDFSVNKNSSRLLIMFNRLNVKECIGFASIIQSLLFVLSFIIFKSDLTLSFIIYFVVLYLIKVFIFRRPENVIFQLFSCVLFIGAMFMQNVLYGYIKEVSDKYIYYLVAIMLSICAAVYAIYIFVYDIKEFVNTKVSKRNVLNEKENN